MIRWTVLGSGSCGNSYIVETDGHALMFDAGMSLRMLRNRCSEAGQNFDSIEALCITHLHPDHACGAGVFARATGLPVYVNIALTNPMEPALAALGIPHSQLRTFSTEHAEPVGPFEILAFATSHDSPASVGFSCKTPYGKFLILTDTGLVTEQMRCHAKESSLMFIEANYEEAMLEAGPYPWHLKRRIAGQRGHLSNSDALEFLASANGGELSPGIVRHVCFCHISKTNNDPVVLENRVRSNCSWKGSYTICKNGALYTGTLGVETGGIP